MGPREDTSIQVPNALTHHALEINHGFHCLCGELCADPKAANVLKECYNNDSLRNASGPRVKLVEASDVVPELLPNTLPKG